MRHYGKRDMHVQTPRSLRYKVSVRLRFRVWLERSQADDQGPMCTQELQVLKPLATLEQQPGRERIGPGNQGATDHTDPDQRW